jgi:hypothetical protein
MFIAVCPNAPITVDGIEVTETGTYLPYAKGVYENATLYYTSSSAEPDEPITPTFDHQSFQIGLAVGLGLKGKFARSIDTGINETFTKGVEVGQKLKEIGTAET